MGVVDGKTRGDGGKENRRLNTGSIGVVEKVAGAAVVADALGSCGEGSSAHKGSGSKGADLGMAVNKPAPVFSS